MANDDLYSQKDLRALSQTRFDTKTTKTDQFSNFEPPQPVLRQSKSSEAKNRRKLVKFTDSKIN